MSGETTNSTYADIASSILELDRENLTVTVNGAVNFLAFQQYLAQEGFLFPLDNLNSHQTTLAYNVAHGVPSFAQGKYGTFREYVVGLEAALNNGTQIKLGGKNIKNVSGFDIMGLLVNSKEKLGIITQLTLRLLPLPESRFLILTPFDSLSSALSAANNLISGGSQPAKIQVFNSTIGKNIQLDCPANSALLVAEFDGFKPSLKRQVALYKELVAKFTNHNSFDFDNENEIQQLWQTLRLTGGPLLSGDYGKLAFSSHLSKLTTLATALESFNSSSDNSLALMINPGTGFGYVASTSSPNTSDWFLQAVTIVKNNGGLIFSDDFTSTELNIIRDRILAVFNTNSSKEKIAAQGGY